MQAVLSMIFEKGDHILDVTLSALQMMCELPIKFTRKYSGNGRICGPENKMLPFLRASSEAPSRPFHAFPCSGAYMASGATLATTQPGIHVSKAETKMCDQQSCRPLIGQGATAQDDSRQRLLHRSQT